MAGWRKAATPCLLLALGLSGTHALRTVHDDMRLFEDFKATYGRRYSLGEEARRLGCFRRVLSIIDERNAASPLAVHSVNQFSDMCPEEFAAAHARLRPANVTGLGERAAQMPPAVAVGEKINWADKGAVTPVKNQGQCGSCWAFTAVGNMESVWQIAGNPLVGLSEEQLVQCSSAENDNGCRGGLMVNSYEYVIKNGGINSEKAYPYTSGNGVTGTCNTAKAKVSVAHFNSYTKLPKDEAKMADWVYTHGPISVAIDALTWQTYSGGILSNCKGKSLDFSAVVVGFDDAHSPPYWIIKNSWGSAWGEQGYIRILKGKDECGITGDVSTILM